LVTAAGLFAPQEILRRDVRLPQDGAQRALWQVAGVIGNSGVEARLRVVLDFMTARGLAVERENMSFWTPDDLPVLEPRESSHQVPTISV
jgi:hypothetical protein